MQSSNRSHQAGAFVAARGVSGSFTAIDVPGAPRNLVFGLNDRGRIVGAYENTDATPTVRGARVQRVGPHPALQLGLANMGQPR